MATDFRYQQLENWLFKGIEEQRWRAGERLPSVRALCQQQQLSKATVLHALHRLEAKGLVEARPKSGYFVTRVPEQPRPPVSRARIEAPRPVTVSDLLLDIMSRSAAFDLRPSRDGRSEPVAGVQTLHRSIGRALRRQRPEDHQYYDDPKGDHSLREQLARHQQRRGWAVEADDLCITSGCQHALFLALMACCQKGDVVAVESPGFYGSLQLLEQLGLQMVEIPTSTETGLDVEALEEVLDRWQIKACIVTPAFATPTGALMPLAAKQRLIELANQHELAIIEDDLYADLSFGPVPDPLKTLDTDERVILCSSLSKSLSRDLRLGWISGARWHRQILHLKLVTQLASSRYLQQGVAEFISQGHLAAHLRRQRHELELRRNQLLTMLQQWPVDLRVSVPTGGLAVWLELPKHLDSVAVYPQALEAGVVITPGPLFSASGQFKNCLRLSYAHEWTEERMSALQWLAEHLAQHSQQGDRIS